MRIGELSRQTGASPRALRYYEEQGLLVPERSSSAQRHYAAAAVDRVILLRRLYAAGLTSRTIASLLPCVDAPSPAVTREAVGLMRREHTRLGDQIAELTTTRDQLAYLIDAAQAYHDGQTTDPTCEGTGSSAA
ncbi:DNA-binding transcriptional regulator, MerR family [Jatrophihabitans endophyticus]|uniref:DNA-binding transcriptional regulator, MerR family n=1 Tax=Jatrophihabitans endophyticus TaxID=1206085 RepID=A0A1M5G8T6_9ACTN|nr:MerR family transcriptional regulator [Jatrophihabitans endophyticus]SHG00098.1 DNA-binding transcriptional regulator, MerR family [Jatrophihabitans endophyticus]